ncbi:MAG: MBL fold metallo-hydrolase [Candidatus Margulisiibacteriota bacterium]
MKIKTIVVGAIATNCYIVRDENSKEAFLIDPGDEQDKISAWLKELKLDIKCVILTHGHFDHVTALPNIEDLRGVPVYMHKDDLFLVTGAVPKFAGLFGYRAASLESLNYLNDLQQIKIGDMALKIIHTPGHTPGGICVYLEKEKALFTGDTLFFGDHGRVDLPASSGKMMLDSLKRLLQLPDDVAVYPGHGRSTTIGNERKTFADIL